MPDTVKEMFPIQSFLSTQIGQAQLLVITKTGVDNIDGCFKLYWTDTAFNLIRFLTALDTFDNNCQRPVFSLGVYQRIHKITNL